MVGMFVCLCLASKKSSKQEFFVPTRTDLAVKLFYINYYLTFVEDLSKLQAPLATTDLTMAMASTAICHRPPLAQATTAKGGSGDGNGGVSGNDGGVAAET